MVSIASALKDKDFDAIKKLNGVVWQTKNIDDLENYVLLPSFQEVREDKKKYAKFALVSHNEQNPFIGKTLIQHHIDRYIVQNPPSVPLNTQELDETYSLPYMRTYHPIYEKDGGIPAITEVKFSIASQRGCYGGCNFCSLAYPQGRIVTSRSEASILKEAEKIIADPDFKGYIHDVGGPTANFRFPACEKQLKSGACKERQCLFPTPCKNLRVNHEEYLGILRKLRNLKGVKKVFVRSGIRFDYLIEDKDTTFFKELVEHHVSGQLKVAPEHSQNRVLSYMGKPKIEVFQKFKDMFYKFTKEAGKEQYLVPYLISSHPGSTLEDAIGLSQFLKKNKITPEQVQDFYPTPGTVSTAMYYTETDIFSGKPIYVAKAYKEKNLQRALLQMYKAENRKFVTQTLREMGKSDLIPKVLGGNTYEKGEKNGKGFRRKSSLTENKGRNQSRNGSFNKKGNKNRSGSSNRGR